MNEFIFIFHALIICSFSLIALRIGKQALIPFIAILGILSNLFITKQILLFDLTVTATDVYVIGAMLSLQLLQEYYGKKASRIGITISFFMLIFYTIMSIIHLKYLPSILDSAHPHFQAVLEHMPRITAASLTAYFLSQLLDYHLYGFLKKVSQGKYLTIRSYFTLAIVQLFDTIAFSFLGLYGIINSIKHIIIVSFSIKMVVILMTIPFVSLSKLIVKKNEQ